MGAAVGVLDLLRRWTDKGVHSAGPSPVRTTTAPEGGFAVVDVETTGLSPAQHRVLEVAVVRTDPRGRVVGEWAQRIDPGGPVGATHVHSITDADVAGAPTFGDVIPQLNSRLAGAAVVAHNARFDLAFLRAEYARLGWSLPWVPALCTLEASDYYLPGLDRRRLTDCCSAARIRVGGVHSALGDARAAAALLGYYLHPRAGAAPRPADLDIVRQAADVRWPTGPTQDAQPPASRVVVVGQPMAPTPAVAAPRLAELLVSFSLTDALDEGAPTGSLPYVETLAEALEDGVLTGEEVAVLDDVAAAHQLSAEDRTHAHRALLLALCHLALDDGRVSRSERAELRSMTTLLGLPDSLVAHTLDHAEDARNARLSAGLQPLPAAWPHGDPLRVGDKVVFTGCDEPLRRRLERRAEELGVRVLGGVSRKTAMLVTDGRFVGTKAEAARQLSTRTVHPGVFEVLLRHLQPALRRQNPGARPAGATERVIPRTEPAGPSVAPRSTGPDPAAVRQWARANGYLVGTRGRLPQDIFVAYESASHR